MNIHKVDKEVKNQLKKTTSNKNMLFSVLCFMSLLYYNNKVKKNLKI